MERKEFEIMAPVGSYESLYAAIQGGADAIYFGIEGLNMRAKSSVNFTIGDLHEIARICAEHGMKSYLTVNTVVYDDDMAAMRGIIDAAKEAGISAIIASDMAAILYARSVGVEVHISTQVNVSNTEAVRFYSQFADVMVLARELNLTQVAEIYDAITKDNITGPHGRQVRIEMFCHGALCMAVSGKCYLSLHEMNSSANRGACTQICRRGYEVTDLETGDQLAIENKYIMSPKDLKTIHFLNKMIDAGVRVFKIEGRARGPEYVRTVVECYDEALKAIAENRWSEEISQSWDARLATVFNRGFWDGFYLGQPIGELTEHYGSRATEKKFYTGKCLKYYSKLGVAEFLVQAQNFKRGEKLLITGPTTGAVYVTPEKILVDDAAVEDIQKGMDITFKVAEKVRENDKLYVVRTVNSDEDCDQ